jgi:hypothetical protein
VAGLIESAELRQDVASRGYQKYLKHYRTDVFADRVLDLYQQIKSS